MNADATTASSRKRRLSERRRPKRRGQPAAWKLGQYIVADPRICHGKPTFKGTRIMVWQVLSDVAKGKDWDFIANRQWGGCITRKAIAEAVQFAGRTLLDEEGRLIAQIDGQRLQRAAA